MLRGLRIRALVIALFAFYVAPILPLTVLTSLPNFLDVPSGSPIPMRRSPWLFVLAWIVAIAPVGSAYFAARLAQHQPLLHGLVAGIAGAVLITLWMHAAIVWFEILLALLIASCGLFGGWLWRYQSTRARGMY